MPKRVLDLVSQDMGFPLIQSVIYEEWTGTSSFIQWAFRFLIFEIGVWDKWFSVPLQPRILWFYKSFTTEGIILFLNNVLFWCNILQVLILGDRGMSWHIWVPLLIIQHLLSSCHVPNMVLDSGDMKMKILSLPSKSFQSNGATDTDYNATEWGYGPRYI